MDKRIWLFIWIAFSPVGVRLRADEWFTEEAESRGLRFRHFHGGTGRYYLPESLGSGAALIDYDNDGDLDIYMLQGAALEPGKDNWRPSSASASNRLFRNLLTESKRLAFEDVTARAGLTGTGYSMGAAVGDYDGDGFADLFITGVNRVTLFRNLGNGSFSDVTRAAGLDTGNHDLVTTGAAFFDYDRDGDLDLLVLSYVDFTITGNKACPDSRGRLDYCKPSVYQPLPARLFRNEGKGKFTDVSRASGIGNTSGAGLGIAIADFNGDGWLDAYIANDGTANHLWMNRRNGTFEETGLSAGAAYDDQGRAQAGMGVVAADLDMDGDEDIAVTNLMGEGHALYENNGGAEFTWGSAARKLTLPSLPFTGFGLVAADFDHDGRLDLFAANGSVSMLDSKLRQLYPYGQRNQLFRARTEAGYEEVRSPILDLAEASRGAAFGDLDRDGDIDIVISNSNGPARLLLNQVGRGRSLTVDTGAAEGALVTLRRAGQPEMRRRSTRAGSYLSSNDPAVHFGLGHSDAVEEIIVKWPDGSTSALKAPSGASVSIRP